MYDCIVVGVGGHGSATLAHLAKAGKKVLGLEQFKPVHAHGEAKGMMCVNNASQQCTFGSRFIAWEDKNIPPGLL